MAAPPSGMVTFLLTDIEGSSRLWETHPEGMGRALAEHDRVLREAIDSHHGYLFATAGDSIGAAFHEAADAVNAALAAQLATKELAVGEKRCGCEWRSTPARRARTRFASSSSPGSNAAVAFRTATCSLFGAVSGREASIWALDPDSSAISKMAEIIGWRPSLAGRPTPTQPISVTGSRRRCLTSSSV